ncbi:MAG: hypothetical protein Q4E69_01105 [Bacilli bacterium]|nr:hypothetical protein [Bacilli bacterium]
MNKGKIRLILEIIISILIVIFLGIILCNVIKFDSKDNTKETKEMIEELNTLLINGGTKEEIIALTGIDEIDSRILLTGPDSYMALYPDKSEINNENIDAYIEEQNKLVKNVENKIKSNFNATVQDIKEEDNSKVYKVLLKSYYQITYLEDLQELQKKVLLASSLENNTLNNYKSKVLALKILDSHLDYYVNKDENCLAILYDYKDDKDKTKQSIISYINMLQGINYHNEEIIEEDVIKKNKRLQEYIVEAKNNNSVNIETLQFKE